MPSPPPNIPSLYRRILGDAFENLPRVLREFHSHPSGTTAHGTLKIARGEGNIRHLIALLMRLPPKGEQIPITLQVHVEGERECWIRDFGSHRLVTRQWWNGHLLIESAGPLRFGFQVTANHEGMDFRFARCWLLALPLPTFLAPKVNAIAKGMEEGWWIQVCMEVPLFGIITKYEGKVIPQCG